jgi:DNA primase
MPKPVSEHWRRSLAKAAKSYYESGAGDANFREYLMSRGITLEAQRAFRLGLVITPAKGHEEYAGRLAIPYITRSGVVTIRFRALTDDTPKYRSLPGSLGRARPFNPRALLSDADEIIVCEGEIDTITAWMCGYHAIGFPGASSFNPKLHAELFELRRIVVCIDNDDKGAGKDFYHRISSVIPEARGVVMPPGHDLNSYFVSNGKSAVRALIAESDEDEETLRSVTEEHPR